MSAAGGSRSSRDSRPLGRRPGIRPERKTILVFTEGKKTEPDYIKGLKALEHVRRSASITVEIAPDHQVPYPLIKAAVQRRQDVATHGAVDEVWSLIDVEAPTNHPHLRAAIELAEANDVRVAVSNPCFEIWLLLHDKECNAYLTTGQAEAAVQSLPEVSGKEVRDASGLVERRAGAAQRAVRLRGRHERNGTRFPEDNPSTTVDLFVLSVEERSRRP